MKIFLSSQLCLEVPCVTTMLSSLKQEKSRLNY